MFSIFLHLFWNVGFRLRVPNLAELKECTCVCDINDTTNSMMITIFVCSISLTMHPFFLWYQTPHHATPAVTLATASAGD